MIGLGCVTCLYRQLLQFCESTDVIKASSAKDGTYDHFFSTRFSSLKYENGAEVDKVAAINQKIAVVQLTMHGNIEKVLGNLIKLESLEQQAGSYES